jgi:hypothetical protein
MIGYLWLYDIQKAPNDPLKVSGYVADVYATRAAGWTATKCVYCCFNAKLYEVANPLSRPANQQGRTLSRSGIWSRDLTTVKSSDLTYPPGRQPSPEDPQFKVLAAQIL